LSNQISKFYKIEGGVGFVVSRIWWSDQLGNSEKLCNSHNEKAYSSLNFVKFQNMIRQISSHNVYLQNARMDLFQLPWWLTSKPSNYIFTKVTWSIRVWM